MKIPPEFQDLLNDLLSEISSSAFSLKYKGEIVEIPLKKGQYAYRYFRSKSGAQYCYTVHPSTKGDYFVWTYAPKGKGSRSGSPERLKLKDLVRCAKRKTAKKKALDRYYKEDGFPSFDFNTYQAKKENLDHDQNESRA